MPAKQYVDLNGITVYDNALKDYIANLGVGVTYTLTQDTTDPHKLILTPSRGSAQEVTVPDNNTTYSLSQSGNDLVLTPSSGTADTITLGDLAFEDSLTASDVGAISTSEKGANSGIAELDANGKVPSSQLPSYVDDVEEYATESDFPATGESGKIYVDISTNKTFRWSGSAYVEIGSSLALGETSSTAYRGDRGKTAYDHASAKGSEFASGLYKITTNSEGHVTGATAVAKADITALGIPAQDTTYTSKAAVSGGTDVSLVTTGEKATWNAKTSNTGTVTSVATGTGLTGGTITTSGTISTHVPRVAKSANSLPGLNKIIWEEYAAGTNYNLPTDHWYHIITMEGSDGNFATQLALGLTVTAAFYRNYNAGTWSGWNYLADSHWTTHLYAGTGGAANAATSNGGTYLTVCDEGTPRNNVKIQGSGGTSVSSDAWGNVTIYSAATAGPTTLSGGLAANATSLSFTNAAIGNDTRFDIYTSVYGVNPTNMAQSGNTLTLAFSSSHAAATIKVHCWNT